VSEWSGTDGGVEMIDPSMADLGFCAVWEFFGECSPVCEQRGRRGCRSCSGFSGVLM